MLGWLVTGAAALGGFLLYKEGAFGSGPSAPEPTATRVTRSEKTGPKGLELFVLQADEDEGGWDVLVTEFEMRGRTMGNGRIREIRSFPTKRDAVAAAKGMAEAATIDGRYAAVRLKGVHR